MRNMRSGRRRSPRGDAARRLDRRRFRVVERTLPNGLALRLLPDRTLPIVSLYAFFRAGSRVNVPGATGLSHLFEHLYFGGAAKWGPNAFDRALEGAGGRSNAYTSHDLVVFHEDFPSPALPLALALEADRLGSLALTQDVFERERSVVMEERRLVVDNDPMGKLDEELRATAFRLHPYGAPIIGWREDLERLALDDCLAFRRAFLHASACTLWLVGDFDPDAAGDEVARAFGSLPAGAAAPSVTPREPAQRGERIVRIREAAQVASLALGWRAPAARDDALPVLEVLPYALGAGEGSRLVRGLVHEARLASDVAVDLDRRLDPGLFTVSMELGRGVRPEQALSALDRVLGQFIEAPIEQGALERARGQLRAHALAELETRAGRAEALGESELILGDWERCLALPEQYAAVGRREVREAAAALFDRARRSVAILEGADHG